MANRTRKIVLRVPVTPEERKLIEQKMALLQTKDVYKRQAPSSAADTKRGMGIGLSICKAIITAHNGEIHAINHADGAEFFFNLPKEAISHESAH